MCLSLKDKMALQSSKIFFMMRKVFVIWMMMMAMLSCLGDSKCEFEAIFNFGDSNTETGGFWAAFPPPLLPFGMTYFKRPSGRASDGRNIIDFLAQALGFPYLDPYLQSIGSDFRHGANYATAASTVLLPQTSLFVGGLSPFSLAIQLNQMKNFKTRVEEFNDSVIKTGTNLPSPDVFGKSIYNFFIGQNDFTSQLADIGIDGVKKFLPDVINTIAWTIKEIYAFGGRTFFVLNLAPIGCYPSFLVKLPHNSTDVDMYGCLLSYNNAVVDYNNMLKETLDQMRKDLPQANLIHVDHHAILLDLFRHPTAYGLTYGPKACCGLGGGAYNFNADVFCGNNKVIDGKNVTATACSDPFNYVSWDGIHATEAANLIMTKAILNGSYFDPPFPINELCDLHPI
ncbi:GDSL esterase/lipase At4g01130-like [Mangifera indica]|uniref:GDSL esterase/lipase At4g01130-like n=1 Tax=Mangifera indica TaxID=29780 RepID=UPI001CFB9E48|nr:GDSL esterase/lipase At4g01130-like [Mangifera indica]